MLIPADPNVKGIGMLILVTAASTGGIAGGGVGSLFEAHNLRKVHDNAITQAGVSHTQVTEPIGPSELILPAGGFLLGTAAVYAAGRMFMRNLREDKPRIIRTTL